MPQYLYRARDKAGKYFRGTLEARDTRELARGLRELGQILISTEDASLRPASQRAWDALMSTALTLRRVKLVEKMLFSKNMGVMVGAGLPLTRALEALGREAKPYFKKIIEDLIGQIREGRTLAEAVGRHPQVFPSLYVSMIEAGEKSGKLQESFAILASHLQSDYELIRKVRGAFMYPGLIFVAMILVGVLMLIYVVPTLVSVFTELNAELPFSTRLVIGISGLFVNHPLLILLIVAAIAAALVLFFRSQGGKHFLDDLVIWLPLLNRLAKEFNAARSSRTLASLLSSGVQVLEALDITSRVVQNHRYSEVLQEAKVQIQHGNKISEVFLKHTNLYPALVGEMLAVGEETGSTPNMLNEMATFYEKQVADITRDLATIIEPVLMILVGTVVGFFAISMITPLYSVLNAL